MTQTGDVALFETVNRADYGQALISRWPLSDTKVHDLSYPEREPRRAICACIETPAGPIKVVATHLGLSLREPMFLVGGR